MPNQVNIRKWVEALRSGEYPQTTNWLAKEGRYCCLGVACELAVKDGLPVEVTFNGAIRKPLSYNGFNQVLPPAVRDWLGLDELDPYAEYEGSRHKLSLLNDDGAFDFNAIADVIESTWLAETKEAERV